MQFTTEKSIKRIIFCDFLFRNLCKLATFVFVLTLCFFFCYITFKAVQGLNDYGFNSIFLHLDFNLNSPEKGVSFWAPFFVTLLITVCVVFICIPFAIKSSIWLTFFARPRLAKFINFFVELLSTFPSIIFGLFTRNYVCALLKNYFELSNSMNVLMAIFTLLFMTLPLIISLLNSDLKNNSDLIECSVALGIEKRQSIYKLVVPNIKKTIAIAVSIVFSKVISESVALTFLLSNENYKSVFDSGFFSIFTSQLNPIAPLISENFFSDGAGENAQNVLFTFSFLLLLLSLFINRLILLYVKKDKKQSLILRGAIGLARFIRLTLYVKPLQFLIFILTSNKVEEFDLRFGSIKTRIRSCLFRLFFFNQYNFKGRYITLNKVIYARFKRNLGRNLNNFWKACWEYLSIVVISLFIILMMGVILVKGSIAMSISGQSSWMLGYDGLLRAILNTTVIVILSLAITLPISFLTAIYLSEYCQSNRLKKIVFSFVNVSCSTPSIVFGIFGLSFFIYKMGLSSSGVSGKSLLAGILTISLFICAHLVHIFHAHFQNFSIEKKEAAYALGMSKFKTFSGVIMPGLKEELICSLLMYIGKILGETAPLYLTAGLNSVSITHLMYPGQTLTTKIYAELFNQDIDKSVNNMFESALTLMILMMLLMYMVKVVIPFMMKWLDFGPKVIFSYWLIKLKYYKNMFIWYCCKLDDVKKPT